MNQRATARGLTLVELMVAIAIGLFIVLAVVNVMVTQEGIRRNATGGNDAMANGAVAMLIMERSIKNAGYGLGPGVPSSLMSTCTPLGISGKNEARATKAFTYAAFEFAPVVIGPASIPAGDTGTQVIRVTYTGNHIFGASVLPATAVSPNVRVGARAGLNSGDLVVVGQDGLGCAFREITSLPNNTRCGTAANVSLSDAVQFEAVTYKNDYKACADTEARFNDTGSLPFAFVPSAGGVSGLRIYTVGDPAQFRSMIYAVRGQQLRQCDFISQPCEDASKLNDESVWQPLVDDVVGLRAQYGIDTNNDTVVDSWTATTPTTMAGWDNMRAFRLAVVTRSKAFNKDEVVVDSGTGKNSPAWVAGDVPLTHLADWKHYRYSVSETTVVLKNTVWK